MFCIIVFVRKVWLGYKKTCKDRILAIKVMKKADLINKNLMSQGKYCLICYISETCSIYCRMIFSPSLKFVMSVCITRVLEPHFLPSAPADL